MKKYIKYIVILFIITITLLNFNIISNSISNSFNLCISILLPSIIPFLLLSSILIKYNILNSNIYSLILLCIISGSPSNSKYIKDYLDNKIIDIKDAQKLLNYLQYYNPLYILNGIGLLTLNSKKLGLIILISTILSSLLLKKEVNITPINTKNSLFEVLSVSISNVINTTLFIIGVITFFFIFTSYIDIIFHIKDEYKFLYGILEITQGINYLKYSNLSIYMKTIISSVFISFGGLSMHLQIFGILDNKKIRYKPYLINRIKHSILSVIITSILFHILN